MKWTVLVAVAVLGVVAAVVVPEIGGASKRAGQPAPRICDRYASAVDGSDQGNGTWERPFRSAQRLLRKLRRGEVGCLRGGTYESSEIYVLDVTKPDVTLRSLPRERATVRGIVIVRPGADRVRLSRLSFQGTGAQNTIKVYSANFVLDRSDVTNEWRGKSCMILGSNSEGWTAADPLITMNRFRACGRQGVKFDHGIYAANVVNARIVANVFSGVAGYTLILYPNAQRSLFAHNVVDGSEPSLRGGIVFGGDHNYESRDNVAENNVIAFAQTFNITSNWDGDTGGGNVARRNCLWAGEQGDIGPTRGFAAEDNVSVDPRFVDAESGDFRLRAGSRCLSVVGYDTAARVMAP